MIGPPRDLWGSPREVDPHREPGENLNGTSGEDHPGGDTGCCAGAPWFVTPGILRLANRDRDDPDLQSKLRRLTVLGRSATRGIPSFSAPFAFRGPSQRTLWDGIWIGASVHF